MPTRTTSAGSRMRMREELAYLRVQVHELEVELEALQQAKRSRLSVMTSGPDHGGNIVQSSVVWERLAKRQMSAKQKAEAENIRLRETLQGQLKIARGLERLLRKQSTTEAQDIMQVLEIEMNSRKRTDSDEAVHEQLKLTLDDRYREINTVFRKNGLATNRDDLETIRVISGRHERELGVEIVYAKVFPFDFTTTSTAVWTISSANYVKLVDGYYSAQPSSEDAHTAKFETSLIVRREHVTLDVYAAAKRYRESEERQVYAWESWSIVRSSSAAYDGILLQNHGWNVVESVRTDDPDHPATIIQSCSRQFPDPQSLPNQSLMGLLNDVLVSSYNRSYTTLY